MPGDHTNEWTKTIYTCRYHWKWILFWAMFILFGFLSLRVWADTLEIPGHGSIQSGIGVISGWKCRANGRITVRFDGGRSIPLVYGSERTDTRGVCEDANNGFVAIWNWGALDDGTYTVVAYDNDREFDRATFTVVTTGVEFLRDVTGSGTATLSNGQQATLEWSQATQSFVATDFTDPRGTPVTPEPVETPEARQLRGLIGTWAFTLTVLDPPNQSPIRRSYTVSRVEQTDAGAGAIGRDPADQSTFLVIVSDPPAVLEGQSYPFFLVDVDRLQSGYICSSYFLRQSGNRLTGYFGLAEGRGPDLSQCDADTLFAVGTVTATRR